MEIALLVTMADGDSDCPAFKVDKVMHSAPL